MSAPDADDYVATCDGDRAISRMNHVVPERWREAAVFDKFDDKGPKHWSHKQRRAALEGLKRLADRGEARFDAPGVSEHLRRWTEHTAELMSKHNFTRAPVAVGMKWMGGYGTGGLTMKEAQMGMAARTPLTIIDNQGLADAFGTRHAVWKSTSASGASMAWRTKR